MNKENKNNKGLNAKITIKKVIPLILALCFPITMIAKTTQNHDTPKIQTTSNKSVQQRTVAVNTTRNVQNARQINNKPVVQIKQTSTPVVSSRNNSRKPDSRVANIPASKNTTQHHQTNNTATNQNTQRNTAQRKTEERQINRVSVSAQSSTRQTNTALKTTAATNAVNAIALATKTANEIKERNNNRRNDSNATNQRNNNGSQNKVATNKPVARQHIQLPPHDEGGINTSNSANARYYSRVENIVHNQVLRTNHQANTNVIRFFRHRHSGFIRPVNARINSPFGMRMHPIDRRMKMHTGVDFAAPMGTPIRAAADGIVMLSEARGGYGNMVLLEHGIKSDNSNWSTLYGHASRLLVRVGQFVKQGEVIALVGSTGKSTGPHLHFEILKNGQRINPEILIPDRQISS